MIYLIRESQYFIFNGMTSESYKIYNVNMNSGMLEEPFSGSRSIVKQRVRGNPRSYIIDYTDEPLTFSVSFAFADGYDEYKIREVARWLLIKKVAPLQFSENLDRIFYGSFIGDYKLIHNGLREGYIELQFECNSPYSYTPVYESSIIDLSNNTSDGTPYTFVNTGDLPTNPLIMAQIISGGTFSITNNSNGGQKLEFLGLADGESLAIDCESETVETDMPATFRYANMSEDSRFLEMLFGHNFLNIKGNIKLQFRWQSPLLQG